MGCAVMVLKCVILTFDGLTPQDVMTYPGVVEIATRPGWVALRTVDDQVLNICHVARIDVMEG